MLRRSEKGIVMAIEFGWQVICDVCGMEAGLDGFLESLEPLRVEGWTGWDEMERDSQPLEVADFVCCPDCQRGE